LVLRIQASAYSIPPDLESAENDPITYLPFFTVLHLHVKAPAALL
jgi:hypothetical protein